jgi:acyl transferase domain-containing protein/acyl carrier protein
MHNILRINATQWVTTYPETIPSCIGQLPPRLPTRDDQLASLHSAGGLARGVAMEELLRQLLWGSLQALGLFHDQEPMAVNPATGLPQIDAGLLPLYDRWFAESLVVLKEFFHRDSQSITVLDPTPLDLNACWRAWDEHTAVWSQDDGQKALVVLVEACLRALPEVLTGKRPATEVLFPDGSMHLVEGVYKGNAGADYFNGVLADTAVAYVRERLARDPAAEIRLLEIGAGTGGTTATVLPALTPFTGHIREYCYTDLSKAFLLHAEEHYAPGHPYLTTRLFDVSRPIDGQDIDADRYDLVIAANVLHATKNIRQTLRNAKAPLKKHGLMLLNELHGTPLVVHLTFGLLEGWWLYDDPALRLPGNPGLSPHTWQRVLEEEGLRSVWFPVEPAHDLGQQLIVAESDGVVRQGRAVPSDARRGKAHSVEAIPAPQEASLDTPTPKSSVMNVADFVTATILQGLCRSLKISADSIDHRKPFSDYGLDSILGVSFVKHLNDGLGINLNTAIVFDHTSVDRLARHVVQTHGNRIRILDTTAPTVPIPQQHTQPDAPAVRAEEGQYQAPSPLVGEGEAGEKGELPRAAGADRRRGKADDHVGIAVIGMSGQFPDAESVDIFWQNLINGVDGVRELPNRYLNQALYYSPIKKPGKTYCRWGGILAARTCFDPLFFSISPREAESMSPHQRLILQESWKSLEDAGYNPKILADSLVGVFVGAEPTGYFHESFTGSSDAIVASRLSYYLDLKGPAMVINTGCSSSGVALHLACESLRRGESDLTLAGGVFAALKQNMLIGLSAIGMLSPTGRCHTFDKAADGTAFSEGVGMVVLKRLEDAVADGDPIYGVIRGSGVNQDGASNGITAPSGSAQEALITSVYERFGIDPARIGYVEAHGTGTKLGDPVEANALVRAFRRFTDRYHYCAVGSAKSHIGHTAASAGVIGLIKILLSFKHHRIPGLLHFKELNPLIEFDGSPFYVNAPAREWRSTDAKPLMAALNSFGHSGTNAHLVIEEYIPKLQAHRLHGDRPLFVPLSAQTEEALTAYAAKLGRFLQSATAPAAALRIEDQLQRELTAIVASMLAVAPEDIDPELSLADYGMEWAHLVILRQRLQEDRQVDVDLNELTRCLSLAEVVDYLVTHHRGAFVDRNTPETRAEMAPPVDLEALAYTLQVGREAMKCRVAFLVRDIAELHERLTAFAEGRTVIAGCWRAEVSQGKQSDFLAADEVSREFVARWISEGELDKVAEAWTRGGVVDWQLLHGEDRPPRLNLPTYAFAREHYEAAENLAAEVEARAAARLTAEGVAEATAREATPTPGEAVQSFELLTFEEVWEEQEQAQAQASARSQTLVCFLSDPDHQRALSDLVHRDDADIRLIFVARADAEREQHPRVSADALVSRVNPLDKASYTQVFQRVREEGTHVDAVLYAWAGEDAALVPNTAPMVHMLQAMAEMRLTVGRILFGARCEPDALDRCYLESWIGFERSLGLVWPNIRVAVVLDETEDRADLAWLERLWSELHTATPQSVLYRNGKRHVCRIRPTVLAPDNGTALRMGGTYLITGGCGELGLSFARHLAETRAANLMLTGRSPLDATKRAAIERLEAVGAKALYIQADVCDAAAMREGLQRARQRFGALHGVIHAAGVQSAGSVFEKPINDFQRVLDPKIAGTLVLDQVLRDENLEFICYFSSSAAILGDFGGCDYAMASRFQAAYAGLYNTLVARGERRGRAIAIHWPLWQDGGMGFHGDEQAEHLYLKSSGQRALRTQEGIEIFERILSQDKSQHLVLAGQPERLLRFLAPRSAAPVAASTPASCPRPSEGERIGAGLSSSDGSEGEVQCPLPPGEGQGEGGPKGFYSALLPSHQLSPSGRGDLVLAPMSGEGQVEGGRETGSIPTHVSAGTGRRANMKGLTVAQCVAWDLTELTSRLLQIPRHRLDSEANLADFGYDSISLTEFAAVLTTYFEPAGLGAAITPALLFGHPTLDMLAQYFMDKHGEAMRAFYREGTGASIPIQEATSASSTRTALKREPAAAAALVIADHAEPIAIIGISGRFPQARNVAEMWAILAQGREAVTEIPADRFDWRLYYGDSAAGKIDGRWCGCVPGVREFDPLFFDISPREAETMDPRQRLLLQEAWNALEDAGYGRKQIEASRIGMFVGAEQGDYQELAGMAGGVTASHNAVLAARLAYFLNLHGPNMAIDTACSSGLVAAHQACLSLRAGECTTAIAAGVHLILTPGQLVGMSGAGMLSTDGHCYAFDKRANGLVPGEAVAVVVLKRLSQAEADGDPIYAVICGSGINYDGKTNGITAPNGVSQTDLLNTVYERFRIDPAEIEYIVTHGTGTRLGDPVEINALDAAFKAHGGHRGRGYCALTSCKTNFGHTFAASGLVSLIALVQAIRHRTIPANLNYEQDSDYVNWQESPFYVNKRARPWTSEQRIGAVSAFGMSGTNAHMVVRAYESEAEPVAARAPSYLLVLSARTSDALHRKINDMVACLENGEVHDLARISYTLLEGRWHFQHRCAIVIQDREDAVQVWSQVVKTLSATRPNLFRGEVPRGFIPRRAMHELALDLLDRCRAYGEQPCLDSEQYQENLLTLADLYRQGYELPWDRLFQPGMRRTGLPTYPFAREHYWVAETGSVPAASTAVAAGQAIETASGTLMLRACWNAQDITHPVAPPETASHLAIFCDLPPQDGFEAVIESRMTGCRCLFLQAGVEDIAARFQSYAARILTEIQHLIGSTAADDATTKLIQVVVPNRDEEWPLTGLAGLLQTARLENSTLVGQLIAVDPETDVTALAEMLERECRGPWESRVRYDAGQRRVAGWQEMVTTHDAEAPALPWRDGATYLITGGAGGLGRLIVQDILARTPRVNLILLGRSPLERRSNIPEHCQDTPLARDEGEGGGKGEAGAERGPHPNLLLGDEGARISPIDYLTEILGEDPRLAPLKDAAQAGARVVYRQVDVTNGQAVTELVREIEREFGGLNGIIHAAGIIRDNYIRHKTAQELHDVLAPKVEGLVLLDRATQHLELDFLVCFSSMTGVLGNPGQADYAAANAFMDAYAAYRNGLVAAGQRRGRTLSINWPLWREGGMAATGSDEAWATILRQNTGMIAMHTATGLRALYQALAAGWDQVLVAEGEVSVIRERLFPATSAAHESPAPADVADLNIDQLREHTVRQLKRLLADYLKLDVAYIDAEESLERYGIDSIMIKQLNEQLAAVFGKLSATLFYEYQTLMALADYLVRDHAAACRRWTVLASAHTGAQVPAQAAPVTDGHMLLAREPEPDRRGEILASSRRQTTPTREPIAIIGMSGRYPLAGNLEEFWENLKAGTDCITEIPEDRWPLEGFYHPDKEEAVAQGKSYCKWGGFVERFADFDCLFFNISPREALNMDPQERLFVEACWSLLEDAGYTRTLLAERHGNRVGVFAGITKTGFDLYGPQMWQHGEKFSPHTSFSSVANRVSYLFNLCGPSMPIDTMCSSSLTAVHEACEHLLRHECELAIAGGVNLYLHPTSYTGLCHQRMLSVDGRCKSFGMGGNGYVPGEGVGVVLLKPLARAIADGDRIHAVIRATSINHDGKTNGYTVPNPNAQGALIRQALEKAGVQARAVSYIEAHGTGTDLGDPIEITGLNQAFRASTRDTGFCAIGSVKSNIGHLEAAAGIAGLTKVVLQLQHGLLVPTLHVDELNPNIDFAESPFLPQWELALWRRPQIDIDGATREYSRIAGVSSFGAGGANAHVILEEYRESVQNAVIPEAGDHATRDRLSTIFVFSARKEEELQARVRQLLHAIAHRPLTDADLPGTAYTLQVGREAMDERLALTAGSVAEVQEKLRVFLAGVGGIEGLVRGRVDKAAVAEFAGDMGMARRIENCLDQGQIAQLLGLWVKGLDIDWQRLYGEQRPRRIDLPTYPFAGRRFWLPGGWDRGAPKPAAVRPAEPQLVAPAPAAANAEDTAPVPTAVVPQPAMPETQQPVHAPVVLPPLRQAATAAGRAEQLRAKVKLVPPASVAGTGENAARPKPRGIALQPLTVVRPTIAPPKEAHPAFAAPKPVATPVPAAANVGRPATIPPEILRQDLAASLAEALFLEQEEVALDRPFIDLGLDSIVAAEWVRALNTRYGINITVSRVYDHPNIIEFATFMDTVLAKQEAATYPGKTVANEALTARVEAAAPTVMSRPESSTVTAPAGGGPVEPQHVVSGAAAPGPSVSDEALRQELATSLAEALFLEPEEVALDRPFIDLGLDSIVAAEWVRALNTRYGINITVSRVYDHPTILAFAAFLKHELGPQAPATGAERPSLDDVLQRVQQGQLDIAQAYQLLQRIDA